MSRADGHHSLADDFLYTGRGEERVTTPPRDPVRRAYAGLARRYDRVWSSYVSASVEATLRRLEAAPGERVLDLGCGTGALLASLAGGAADADLTGIDLSGEMLEVARGRKRPPMRLIQGSAEDLPFAAEAFDAVVSTSVFHYFRRPAVALGEIRRVLRPGGRLVVTDWCDDFVSCRACDLVLRLFDRAHFRSYGAAELTRMLDEAGFTVVSLDRYKIDWLWGMMTAIARKPD